MPRPEEMMRERIELVNLLSEMQSTEAGSPISTAVVHDLSKHDDELLETARRLFKQGARITAMWKPSASDLTKDNTYASPGEFSRPTPSVKYRMATRRNVGRKAPVFRDDDD